MRKKLGSPFKKGFGGGGTPSKSSRRRSLNKPSTSGLARTQSSGSGGPGQKKSGLSANIKVAVRVRPENEREQSGAYDNIINVVDKNMLVFDPKENDDTFFFKGKRHAMRDLNKKQKKDKTFTFDNVYGEESTNQQVFEGTTQNIVNTLFDGYNCCVFAYGATGAGKTHTMLGNQDNPGITFLTMKEIFSKVESTESTNFDVFLSYIEVYNEGIRDLLEPSKSLVIREDGKTGTTIAGMTMLKPKSPEEVLGLLRMGNSNRTQHPTDHNKESSRSHAMLQIIVTQKPKDAGLKAEVKTAKLSMIDLAGSEKGSATGHKGERFREGSNINRSLLALGNCINALAAGSKYIPYRDSKLTRLLKDSVGGNCATVMIANISPSSLTYEDTLNTLKYADRAKQIKVDLKKNVVNVEFHVAQYAKIVEDLRTEIETLKQKIKGLEEENESLKVNGGPPPASDQQTSNPNITERLAAACSGQADIDMEDLDSLSMITKLRQQLSVLIEKQKDYDVLQARVNSLEQENGEIKLNLESSKTECETLKQNRLNNTDELLEELIQKREHTLEEIGNERSLLSVLDLRIHYKTLQAERCNLIGIVGIEKEKSEIKMNRSIESLKKKADKKRDRLDTLMQKFNELNKGIQEQKEKNPDSYTAIIAPARLGLDEHKTENILLHSVISSMEREFTRLNSVFLETLPILVRNEKILRGHDIASREDKEKFAELQARIHSSEGIMFAEGVKNSVSEELEFSVLKECCNLNLPSLTNTRRKSSSVEQRILFTDTLIETTQMETGCDETDSANHGEPSVQVQAVHAQNKVQNDYNGVQSNDRKVHEDLAKPLLETVDNRENDGAKNKVDEVASPLKPIESADSIINKLKEEGQGQRLNSDEQGQRSNSTEIPPTPQMPSSTSVTSSLTMAGAGSILGVKPCNKSFMDRLVKSRQEAGQVATSSSNILPGTSSNARKSALHPDSNLLNETVTLEEPASRRRPASIEVRAPDGSDPVPPLDAPLTNKRLLQDNSQQESVESPGKKARLLNETYCQEDLSDKVPSAWFSHRKMDEIPDSPLVIGRLAQSPLNLADATFNKDDASPTPSPHKSPPKDKPTTGETSSDSVINGDNLLAKLNLEHQQENSESQSSNVKDREGDDVNSEKTDTKAVSASNLNSTFPVEDVIDEPMEVDQTVNILDISAIPPKNIRSNVLKVGPSPVKAQMGTSPKMLARRTGNPSPLRESTLLDLKKGGAAPPPSTKVTTASNQHQITTTTTASAAANFAVPSSVSAAGISSSHKTGFGGGSSTAKHQTTGGTGSSVSKSAANKLKPFSSTKGKRTLTSSRSTSTLLNPKPAAAHKLNLPSQPLRSRSPGAPLRGASPPPPGYASSTQASSNKVTTLERKNKGSENQRPPGLQVKSTGLKRSNSAVGRPK